MKYTPEIICFLAVAAIVFGFHSSFVSNAQIATSSTSTKDLPLTDFQITNQKLSQINFDSNFSSAALTLRLDRIENKLNEILKKCE